MFISLKKMDFSSSSSCVGLAANVKLTNCSLPPKIKGLDTMVSFRKGWQKDLVLVVL